MWTVQRRWMIVIHKNFIRQSHDARRWISKSFIKFQKCWIANFVKFSFVLSFNIISFEAREYVFVLINIQVIMRSESWGVEYVSFASTFEQSPHPPLSPAFFPSIFLSQSFSYITHTLPPAKSHHNAHINLYPWNPLNFYNHGNCGDKLMDKSIS